MHSKLLVYRNRKRFYCQNENYSSTIKTIVVKFDVHISNTFWNIEAYVSDVS